MTLPEIVADVFSIPVTAATDDLLLCRIKTWDSMSHMWLIARLEEVFSVEFTGDEIADFRSVGDIRRALSSRGIP